MRRVTDADARPLKVLVYSDDVNTRQQVILADSTLSLREPLLPRA